MKDETMVDRVVGELKDEMTVDRVVGERLRAIRKAADMSLETLARATDRSIGYVSQIERGLSSPTLRDIAAFARALGVPFVELLKAAPEAEADEPVRLDRDRSMLSFRGTGIAKRVLAPRNKGAIEFYVMQIDEDGHTGAAPYSHDGEEAGFVLKGRLQLTIGGRTYRLAKGDSFRFSSRTPHAFGNAGAGDAEVLWINVVGTKGR